MVLTSQSRRSLNDGRRGMRRAGWPARVIATTLLTRSAIHAVFALCLAVRRPGWTEVFETAAPVALIDGSVALVSAVVLASFPIAGAPRFLSAITFADGSGRLATGIALRAFPGLPGFFVTVVALFAVVGVCITALGVVAAIGWFGARRRAGRSWPTTAEELFDPLVAAAMLSFILGCFLIANPPVTAEALRRLASGAAVVLSLAFGVAGFGAMSTAKGLSVSV
jgi:hypothetical protein